MTTTEQELLTSIRATANQLANLLEDFGYRHNELVTEEMREAWAQAHRLAMTYTA